MKEDINTLQTNTIGSNTGHKQFSAGCGAATKRLVSSRWNMRLPLLAALALALAFARPVEAKSKVVGITTAGDFAAFARQAGRESYDAELGYWTGEIFGYEPEEDSQLILDLAVNGQGAVEFDYCIQTTDVAPFDYLDIYLVTSTGVVPVVAGYNPNPSYGNVFISEVEHLSIDLSPWKGETVQLVISAHQDGFMDQFQALIANLTTFTNGK